MPVEIPESIQQLMQKKAYGHVVTRNPDGSPQVSLVWMDADADGVLFNTAEGRVKPRNLRQDPRIIISVQSPEDPQVSIIFHGRASVTEEGAEEHIDRMAQRFIGQERYPWRAPGEKRLLVRVDVKRISGYGF